MRVPNVSVEPEHHPGRRAGPVVAGGRQVAHGLRGGGVNIDEAAQAAGKDPYPSPPRSLAEQPRLRGVPNWLVEKAVGNRPGRCAAGRGARIAVTEAFKTFVAQVVEVSVDK